MLSAEKYLEKEDDIFDYLQQKMSVEQKQKFEIELKNDPYLLDAILIMKSIRLENEYGNALKYTNQLKNLMLENPIYSEPEKNKSFWEQKRGHRVIWIFVWVLSAILFMIMLNMCISNIFSSYPSVPQKEDKPILGNLHYPLKDSFDLSKEDFYYPHNILRANDSLLHQCLEEYDIQNFGAAVIDFEKYLKDKPFQIEVELPYGITLFRLEQYEKAITILTPVSESKVERFAAPAKWYLILSYLALHKEKEARETCTQLLDNEQFGGKAKLIYEKIK